MSKIRSQPVGSLPPACALPSAPSLLISKTKLQHKIPDAKNHPSIIRKNLLTNRSFRLKKPKRYVCALQRIFIRFIYISFAECKQTQCQTCIPYSITVLQLQFTILELLYKVYYIYNIYYIYNKKFCDPQTKNCYTVRSYAWTSKKGFLLPIVFPCIVLTPFEP